MCVVFGYQNSNAFNICVTTFLHHLICLIIGKVIVVVSLNKAHKSFVLSPMHKIIGQLMDYQSMCVLVQ